MNICFHISKNLIYKNREKCKNIVNRKNVKKISVTADYVDLPICSENLKEIN